LRTGFALLRIPGFDGCVAGVFWAKLYPIKTIVRNVDVVTTLYANRFVFINDTPNLGLPIRGGKTRTDSGTHYNKNIAQLSDYFSRSDHRQETQLQRWELHY
jgi:hypothetical protein